MNQQIVDYLQKNKEKYKQEFLIQQLKDARYDNVEIQKAVEHVYGNIAIPPNSAMVHYAGFWVRFMAQLIDMSISAIASSVIGFILMFIMITFGAMTGAGWLESFASGTLISENVASLFFVIVFVTGPLLIFFVIFLSYSVFMINKYQSTIGKKIFGIKVCDEDTLQKALSKYIWKREFVNKTVVLLLLGVIFIFPFVAILSKSIFLYVISPLLTLIVLFVVCLTIVINPKKQGIHDLMAKTVVVYKDIK